MHTHTYMYSNLSKLTHILIHTCISPHQACTRNIPQESRQKRGGGAVTVVGVAANLTTVLANSPTVSVPALLPLGHLSGPCRPDLLTHVTCKHVVHACSKFQHLSVQLRTVSDEREGKPK